MSHPQRRKHSTFQVISGNAHKLKNGTPRLNILPSLFTHICCSIWQVIWQCFEYYIQCCQVRNKFTQAVNLCYKSWKGFCWCGFLFVCAFLRFCVLPFWGVFFSTVLCKILNFFLLPTGDNYLLAMLFYSLKTDTSFCFSISSLCRILCSALINLAWWSQYSPK